MCPRRLNTAGGLAVHIQQVHKLEPENLPRIENALPGRDGYEVEIFGMEGIPAPDVADYKRRKEIELGLAAGSISQPQPKRPKIDNRPLSEDELRAQLEAHKALMGASSDAPAAAPAPEATAAVYNAAPTAYAVPPAPTPGITPLGASPPPGLPGISPPPFMPGVLPPGPFPGVPPMASPFPGMPGFPPGPPPPGFPMPPPGLLPPPGMLPPGAPPFPSGVSRPPLPPPTFVPASSSSPVAPMNGTPASAPPPGFVPPAATAPQPPAASLPPPLVLPNPALEQKYGPFKKKTDLKYADPNFSPVCTVFFTLTSSDLAMACSRVHPFFVHTGREAWTHCEVLLRQRCNEYHTIARSNGQVGLLQRAVIVGVGNGNGMGKKSRPVEVGR
ncbi:hypothetical protein M404DRAFT_998924 [Pisolithus tinctorius Marx 270]|uniref:C2H2-type domain-containing protein n=1 Tax=Pisolithus tinctorius Marx 270 TaxID=870435 RepID=A0A0C3K9H2_PISTI|nr:hypothetical protein M404DRAFT_998924 [Pisolithus tinctorius Marx 270]